jgi:hypothetical protein
MQRLLTVFVTVLGLFMTVPAFAQLSTAQLDGRVTDTSGGVLPGVTVTLTQTETGAVRSAVTDENGGYLVSNLSPGPYQLEAALQGFRTYVQTGIVLQVAASPTINVSLAIGGLEESVTVEAAAPLVDVRSAGVSEVVENERILEMPLQARDVTSLLMMVGAAVNTGSPNSRSFGGAVNVAVAGGLPFGVAYLLDGAMHNDSQNNANLPLPFPDALQEFRVATTGLTAQNGMHSGASVNAVTRSGTNRFSGNLFEFNRDSRFNATDPFARVIDGERLPFADGSFELVTQWACFANLPDEAWRRRLAAEMLRVLRPDGYVFWWDLLTARATVTDGRPLEPGALFPGLPIERREVGASSVEADAHGGSRGHALGRLLARHPAASHLAARIGPR